MELTRAAGRALVRRGVLEITQKGQPVPDIDAMRGPIRFRLTAGRAAEEPADG